MFDFIHTSIIAAVLLALGDKAYERGTTIYIIGRRAWVRVEVRR